LRCLSLAVVLLVAVPAVAHAAAPGRGRTLFVEGCSSCHGLDARGVRHKGPDLHGVGAQAADFYLSTGRMPLDVQTGTQPERARPAYPPGDIEALVQYVGSLGGPGIPEVDPEAGNVSRGQAAYASQCAGCHQSMGRGGVVTGAVPPALDGVTPTQLAEAVRIGPYVMPAFGTGQIDQQTLDSIALYVRDVVQSPPDDGGWGIGNVGPIQEGLVAWLLGGASLLLVARLIGKRQER
jgi:ubiquinol-cytochrome c reductase cytochrome c subunit